MTAQATDPIIEIVDRDEENVGTLRTLSNGQKTGCEQETHQRRSKT